MAYTTFGGTDYDVTKRVVDVTVSWRTRNKAYGLVKNGIARRRKKKLDILVFDIIKFSSG